MEVKGQPGQSFCGSSLCVCVCVLNTGSQSKQLPLLATLSVTLSDVRCFRCLQMFQALRQDEWGPLARGDQRTGQELLVQQVQSVWARSVTLWICVVDGRSELSWLAHSDTDVSSGCGRAYDWDCCGWEEAESMASTAVWPLTSGGVWCAQLLQHYIHMASIYRKNI